MICLCTPKMIKECNCPEKDLEPPLRIEVGKSYKDAAGYIIQIIGSKNLRNYIALMFRTEKMEDVR